MALDQIAVADHPPEDLELMAAAHRYRAWVMDLLRPHLGQRVLEIGAGIGNYAEFYDDRTLVLLERAPVLAGQLRERFAGNPRVSVIEDDVLDPAIFRLCEMRFDTIICLDVIEHIADDMTALRHMFTLLAPGGKLLLKVPAMPALYGSIDRALGHERRYERKALLRQLDAAGFVVTRQHYMNAIGALGWWVNSHVNRRTEQSALQIRVFDSIVVPVTRFIETLVPLPFGQSLFAVALKPEKGTRA